MAFVVQLEDEHGAVEARLPDTDNVLPQLLDRADDRTYCCLPFIDRYGNTVFNQLQVRRLMEELRTVSRGAPSDQQAFVDRLEELAQRCLQEVHLYLKFYGD